jgi:hypothetical protein
MASSPADAHAVGPPRADARRAIGLDRAERMNRARAEAERHAVAPIAATLSDRTADAPAAQRRRREMRTPRSRSDLPRRGDGAAARAQRIPTGRRLGTAQRLQDDAGATEAARPFPFLPTLEPLDYSRDYLAALDVPRVLYKCVGNQTAAELLAWADALDAGGGRDACVLVGAPTSARAQGAHALGLPAGYDLLRARRAALPGRRRDRQAPRPQAGRGRVPPPQASGRLPLLHLADSVRRQRDEVTALRLRAAPRAREPRAGAPRASRLKAGSR